MELQAQRRGLSSPLPWFHKVFSVGGRLFLYIVQSLCCADEPDLGLLLLPALMSPQSAQGSPQSTSFQKSKEQGFRLQLRPGPGPAFQPQGEVLSLQAFKWLHRLENTGYLKWAFSDVV